MLLTLLLTRTIAHIFCNKCFVYFCIVRSWLFKKYTLPNILHIQMYHGGFNLPSIIMILWKTLRQLPIKRIYQISTKFRYINWSLIICNRLCRIYWIADENRSFIKHKTQTLAQKYKYFFSNSYFSYDQQVSM